MAGDALTLPDDISQVAAYRAQDNYPMNGPVKIRVTGALTGALLRQYLSQES